MSNTHESSHGSGEKHGSGSGPHFILNEGTAFKIFGALLLLTAITVGLSFVHLGPFNYIIGMVVATIKASLVIWFFMTLGFDKKSNLVIFLTGLLFITIFFGLLFPDYFFRGNVYVHGPLLKEGAGPKFEKPWETKPEMVAYGKTAFAANCASCHGEAGLGNGPAAASLSSRPRNFTQDVGWKNGRKPSQIFKTLKEGLAGTGMASFATLPQTTRWSIAHYVETLGPKIETDSIADLAAIGVDPNSADASAAEAPTIPIATALRLEAMDHGTAAPAGTTTEDLTRYENRIRARTFSKQPLAAGADL